MLDCILHFFIAYEASAYFSVGEKMKIPWGQFWTVWWITCASTMCQQSVLSGWLLCLCTCMCVCVYIYIYYSSCSNYCFSAQLDLLHTYLYTHTHTYIYITHRSFQLHCYMEEMLSNCFVQLCAPCRCSIEAWNMWQLVCCNVIVILINLSAFVGSNYNNWIITHGIENVKFIGLIVLLHQNPNSTFLHFVFGNYMHFLYGPGEMLVRGMFLGFCAPQTLLHFWVVSPKDINLGLCCSMCGI